MYDPSVMTSLSEHRVTHILETATNELAEHGFCMIPRVAPHDVDALDAGLRAWAKVNKVKPHIGLHGGGVFAHLA